MKLNNFNNNSTLIQGKKVKFIKFIWNKMYYNFEKKWAQIRGARFVYPEIKKINNNTGLIIIRLM